MHEYTDFNDSHEILFFTVPVSSAILSRREQQILALIGAGMTSKEIGAALRLSYLTVGSYRKNICRKLGVGSTAELIQAAIVSAINCGAALGERASEQS